MFQIIDTATDVGQFADDIFNAGVRTVFRYYNHSIGSSLPSKRLEEKEAAQLTEAGLNLAVVFQQNARKISNFTTANGNRDADRALELAHRLQQPEGSTIYFAVDRDFFRASELAAIRSYFDAVQNVLGSSYNTGVYGSGTVGRSLLDHDLVEHVWLSQSMGWSGSKDFLASQDWSVRQLGEKTWPDAGFRYDPNRANPGFSDFGQFSLASSAPVVPLAVPEHSDSTYRVIARTGLNLRRGPGTEFDVKRILANGTHVFVQSISNNWARVDLDGDGAADGYLYAGYLQPVLGGMPLEYPPQATPYEIAQIEMAHGVREYAGLPSNPRIERYHASTAGGAREDDVAWCSSFVNYCVEQAGLQGTDSKWALSWHGWGDAVNGAPKPGDIVVWERLRGSATGPRLGGHVGFVVNASDQRVHVLSGNQQNEVRISNYPLNGMLNNTFYKHQSFRRVA